MPSSTLTLLATTGHLPPPQRIVLATQRLRGLLIAAAARHLRPDLERASYLDLTPDQRESLVGLTGKHGDGSPAQGNRHVAYLPLPGTGDTPDRLLLYKRDPWTEVERMAVLAACRRPLRWGPGEDDGMRLLPLPGGDADLPEFFGQAQVWQSWTPFVPAQSRHRYRKNGQVRPGEVPERQVEVLCEKMGYGAPQAVEVLKHTGPVLIHHTLQARERSADEQPATHWPGYRVRVTFAAAITGPLFLGHSCHFGLGLFAALPNCQPC